MKIKNPMIVLASPSREDAEEIRNAIPAELGPSTMCLDPTQPPAEVAADEVSSILFVFRNLDGAANFYFDMVRASGAIDRLRHSAILVCDAESAEVAHQLCLKNVFDDYVIAWPASSDRYRLATSVHRATTQFLARSGAARLPRILVVEDDSFHQKLIRSNLEEERVHVQIVDSGMAAIAASARHRPDLVLMDVELPDMDGVEITRTLKSSPAFATVPIVMVTGNSNRQIVVASQEAGASDFVVKPVVRDRLVAKIRQRLARPAPANPASPGGDVPRPAPAAAGMTGRVAIQNGEPQSTTEA